MPVETKIGCSGWIAVLGEAEGLCTQLRLLLRVHDYHHDILMYFRYITRILAHLSSPPHF